jgi:hypothetical protein
MTKKYAVMSRKVLDALGIPDGKGNGFRVQPLTLQAGGTGSQPFFIETQEELDAFAARPDVYLMILKFIPYEG